MNSISVKVTILYIFLAILNISLFTIFIFENQIDIITENTKYKAESLAIKIYTQLFQIQTKLENNSEEELIQQITTKMDQMKLVTAYMLFREDGTLLHKTTPTLEITERHLLDSARAIANKDLTGIFYYANITEENSEIDFYIPFKIQEINNIILSYKVDLKYINDKVDILYQFVMIIIGLISIIHIIFGLFLNFILIRPIKRMSYVSDLFGSGHNEARMGLQRKDEIGKLSHSFDAMADSINEKIDALNARNTTMQRELDMASTIQKSIYPKIRKSDLFDLAIYHCPLIEVSGDYHDIFSLKNGSYGFLIADVSGHGVSAALVTLLIKETFQKAAAKFHDPKDLFTFVNKTLDNLIMKYEKYFTAFYLILNKDRKILFTNAGHHEAFVIRAESNKLFTLDSDGVFIGFGDNMTESRFESKFTQLQPKDKIILFTDGIVETRSKAGEAFEHERLKKLIFKYRHLHCEEMLKKITEYYLNFIDTSNKTDDETIMIIELK